DVAPTPTSQPATFDLNDRETSFNGQALSYDADGNLTSDGTNTYTWNARNQLTQIIQNGNVQLSYSYDALGRRTSKVVQGAATQFLYDENNVVQETQGGTTNPILVGLGVDERFARNDVTGRVYYLTDKLNSTIALTDSMGAIQQQYSYDPYGNVTVSNATKGFTNPYQYTGREADSAGFYYYRARYYSSTMGGFISEDPIGFRGGQPSFYGYVNGDPINLIDPLGLCDTEADRCKKVKNDGIEYCSDRELPTRDGLGWEFQNCLNKYIEDHGCGPGGTPLPQPDGAPAPLPPPSPQSRSLEYIIIIGILGVLGGLLGSPA
ncbi:MAG TPA: RHS repeat-associated core domain-containing protein, partial [Dyella sp.]|uniref:RHS repeat domain-containing protein n=1 Tax=Dyella sp. TaxID=1869338 RepID=UPI002C22B3C7